MQITVFGFIWIFVIVFAFFRNNPKYMVAVTLLAMIFQSASVLLMGKNGIGPQVITSGAMIIYTLIFALRTGSFLRIKKYFFEKKISTIAVLVFLIIILVSHKINLEKYTIESKQFYLLVGMLTIYILCYISCWVISGSIKENELETIIIRIITFVTIIGIFQFLTTSNILPKNVLWKTLIYTPDTDSAYYWADYFPRLFSTLQEPSYCGAFLVGAFYYVISRKINTRRICLAVFIAIDIILTFSSTAYGAFAIVGVIYFLSSKNKKAIKYLAPLGIFVVMILFIFYSDQIQRILNSVIFEKSKSGSYDVRAGLDDNAVKQFLSAPKIGVGYKNVRASQFIYSLLGQVGILGAISWGGIFLPLISIGLSQRKKYTVSELLFLISTFISMCIAIPDIDFCIFWQGMYIFALAYGGFYQNNRRQKEKINEKT